MWQVGRGEISAPFSLKCLLYAVILKWRPGPVHRRSVDVVMLIHLDTDEALLRMLERRRGTSVVVF